MDALYEQYLQSINDMIDVCGIDALKEVIDPFHAEKEAHTREYYIHEYWVCYSDCIYEWFFELLGGEFNNDEEFQVLFDDYFARHKNEFKTKEEMLYHLMMSAINDNL